MLLEELHFQKGDNASNSTAKPCVSLCSALERERGREREEKKKGKKVIRISTMTLFHYAGAENLFLPPIDCAFGLGGCAGGRVGGGGEREGSGRLHPTDSG